MAKTFRYDPDEHFGNRRIFNKAKKKAKKLTKVKKRRTDCREFDDSDDQERS